jgi:V/A-type H+-transporting ATPase subunit I
MSHPEKMSKIRVIVPKVYGSRIISTLYDLGALHVKSYSKGKLANLDTGAPLAPAEELSQMLLDVRGVKDILAIEGRGNPEKAMGALASVSKKIEKLSADATEYATQARSLEQERAQLKDMLENIQALEKWGVSAAQLQGLKHSAFFAGIVKDPQVLKQKLKGIEHDLKKVEKGDSYFVLILVQKADEQKAAAAVAEAGLSAIAFDAYNGFSGSQIQQKLKSCEQELAVVNKAMAVLRQEKEFIINHEVLLEEEIKKAELPLQFASTAQVFIASGYVPTKQLESVKKKLASAAQGHIDIEEEHIHHDESVPVKLHNTKKVRDFEVLTRLYELPSYFEFDPSSLMFITFPLFFGFMLGDVGYGIVTLLLFLFLRKKFTDGRALFNVLIYASIVTIAFGFVFGEYFGFEHIGMEKGEALCENVGICFHKEIVEAHGEQEIVYSFPRVLSRFEGIINVAGVGLPAVLVIGAIIGFFHLNIGLLIGFMNVKHAHGLKLAVLEKLSWFVLQLGLALVVLSFAGIGFHWVVGTVIAVGAVVMIALGEGFKGIIEIPGLFSNMLSYMRLGAVGLSSVVLATVINEHLAQPFFEKGGIFIVMGILIMIIGHAINIALGIIGPFLHGIRLHYVECFSKFFHGGGKDYRPFGHKIEDIR